MDSASVASANRRHWDSKSASYQAAVGSFIGRVPKTWGGWATPEAEVGALPDVTESAVLELGCGAAEWSRALRDDGAHVVGLDLSGERLRWARRAGSPPLLQADGQRLPFADCSFDLVVSDHGVLSWADADVVIPEVARVVRPGGCLVFNVVSPIAATCFDDVGSLTTTLRQSYFDLGGVTGNDGSTWFARTYGGWIRVLTRGGFRVVDLVEPRPEPTARSPFYGEEPSDWHARWPAEAIWVARREVAADP